MSRSGPPDACAIGMMPAAFAIRKWVVISGTQEKSKCKHTINSIILMPKCSSTIVLKPMLERDNQPSTVGKEAFTTNST
jgi:hypothetical protein